MITNNWRILDPNFPGEAPEPNETVYLSYPETRNNKLQYRSVLKRKITEAILEQARYSLEHNAPLLWQPFPQSPLPPKDFKILTPHICANKDSSCGFSDDGYCLNGPSKCPFRFSHPEIYIEE